jgi:hypothetical protein
MLIVERLRANEPPLDLALQLLDDHDRRHAGGERAADHRGFLDSVEAREQGQQPIEIQATGGGERVVGTLHGQIMPPLAPQFQQILDSLPSDWTDLELDVRVDERRYIDAAVLMVTCNAQPYSKHDWHWRILAAHHFGHAAAPTAVHGTLKLLDEAEIAGELVLREVRTGRVETVQMWGRPQSVREEFRKIRAQ